MELLLKKKAEMAVTVEMDVFRARVAMVEMVILSAIKVKMVRIYV